MFSCVAMKVIDFPFPYYVIKRKLMIQIQATSELLSYEIERNPDKSKEKVESQ